MLMRAAPRTLDLAACEPQSALSRTHLPGRWQAVEFELTDGRGGTLLSAGPETQAPTIALPLGASGWHRVYLGLWSNWTGSTLRLKLSQDAAFCSIVRERSDNFNVDEYLWREADLTGQSLHIAQQSAGLSQPACLAYVALEPLDGPPPNAPPDRPLIAMDDAFTFFHQRRPTTREDIWEQIQPYIGTDFTRLFWGTGVGGDLACYNSPGLQLVGEGQTDFPRVGDRHAAESLQLLRAAGIDPLATALRFAHDNGLEFHVGHRMEAFQMCAPFDDFFTGRAWRDHSEWRCRDYDGAEIARLSYAHAGVRELTLGVFQDVLDRYDVDGVNPIFNRGAPFLLYEEPLTAGFHAATGLDARALAEDDPRYVRYRASFLTEFMRELRTHVDAASKRRGRRLEVSAHVLNDIDENLRYGIDIETWVQQRLVDRLIAYPWRDKQVDSAAFVKAVQGSGVAFFPDIMPRFMSAEDYRRRSAEEYARGVDGLCFWDTDQRNPRLSEWTTLRGLGHTENLDDAANATDSNLFRSVPLRSVGGMRVDRYPPHWAY